MAVLMQLARRWKRMWQQRWAELCQFKYPAFTAEAARELFEFDTFLCGRLCYVHDTVKQILQVTLHLLLLQLVEMLIQTHKH